MRRFLTLVCLLSLAIPAGISISGCTRNPGEKYCNGLGYGMKITDVASISLGPATTGISMSYGQTRQSNAPSPLTCKNTTANVTTYTYGTSNNKVVDISTTGKICAGTWNRNTGGGIADYTVCSAPDPLPTTGGLPYAIAYITASAGSVTSNPVAVYVHPQVTSVSLVTTSSSGVSDQCYSQNTTATLDAQACYEGSDGTQVLLCAPSSVTSTGTGVNKPACDMPSITADVIASGTYVSGGSITGTSGETCTLSSFNNDSSGATATVTLTGDNTIASGTALAITAGGVDATAAPTTARLSDGTATCSGTATVTTKMTQVSNCTSSIGTLSYSVGTSSVASILTDTSTNEVTITANLPGTTTITASVAGSGSSAGYFSTCPPKSISLKMSDDSTSGTISKGDTANLTTTVIDTNGNAITGLSLNYQSTNPRNISVSSSGAVTTTYPGEASIYAICQPSSCNPAPTNKVGLYGTGLSVSSNPVTITTPGTTSNYVWFAAPGQSQYFASIDLLTGSVGSPIRLPYVPNSMIMDRLDNNILFGSAHELMYYSPVDNTLSGEDTSTPGVALAISPDATQILVNNQEQQLFYIIGSSSTATFGGLGNAATWSPDVKTLYITDNAALNNAAEGITGHTDTLYVYNQSDWTSYALPASPLLSSLPPGVLPPTADYSLTSTLPSNVAISSTVQTPALTIPSVGAYLRGSPTVAHAWCPSGTIGTYSSMIFYPLADTVDDSSSAAVQSDALATTVDGKHVLGAAVTASGATLSDIGITIPKYNCLSQDSNGDYLSMLAGDTLSPLTFTHTLATVSLSEVSPTAINQVVTSPVATSSGDNLAFITYTALETNTNAKLPYYVTNSNGTAGTVGYITLEGSSSIIAPLAGAFSPDNKYFFVSTAGDNMIHFINVSTLTDTKQISPSLPACSSTTDVGCTYSGSGTIVPATVITVKPRSTT
jgi:trimeric autotransporter adhesin